MKLNDMRVATKLWSVILGLLLAMLAVAVWTRYITLNANSTAQAQIENAQNRLVLVSRWRGDINMAVNNSAIAVIWRQRLRQAEGTDPIQSTEGQRLHQPARAQTQG